MIVIDNVHQEEDITDYFNDLLNIDHTIFVFITQKPFEDERFTNFELPRLKDTEIGSILTKFFSRKAQASYLPIINGNPFILSLILKQSPRDAEKEVERFAAQILNTKKDNILEKDLQIVESLYTQSHLTTLEVWLLLQFAALPSGSYDELMLQKYWLQSWTKRLLRNALPFQTSWI
ncbi:MAG: hypothetical protein HC892_21045 [Saprospiraceae bacterium]|nr:hypothetical protein [Saprospiraceae bacterium]